MPSTWRGWWFLWLRGLLGALVLLLLADGVQLLTFGVMGVGRVMVLSIVLMPLLVIRAHLDQLWRQTNH